MEFDASWRALLKPGEAENYFQIRPLPTFEVTAHYQPGNAWWLAECARLVYRRDRDEAPENPPALNRRDILLGMGLEEIRFFNFSCLRAILVRSISSGCPPFSILVFRGSQNFQDWLANLNALPVACPGLGKGQVHQGFRDSLMVGWREIAEALDQETAPLFYTGHSLGGALAVLAAAHRPPRALYTFGAPKVGDQFFCRALQAVPHYRLVNGHDIVPSLPPDYSGLGFIHSVAPLRLVKQPGGERLDSEPIKPWHWLKRFYLNEVPRWHEFDLEFAAPPFLSDHAPINYVAAIRARLEE